MVFLVILNMFIAIITSYFEEVHREAKVSDRWKEGMPDLSFDFLKVRANVTGNLAYDITLCCPGLAPVVPKLREKSLRMCLSLLLHAHMSRAGTRQGGSQATHSLRIRAAD